MARLGFIVGGVQKAGTTSLFGYLREHPGLLPPRRKELHYFDNEGLDWSNLRHHAIKQAFPVADPARIAFEATPAYLFWPRALERIRAYDPQIKLIFIFRDPIERAWSHWRMEAARGDETLPFHEAIRGGRRRLADANDTLALRRYSYVERGFYARQLAAALELFPRDNMLLLCSNDLRDDPSSVLSAIAGFLDISPFPTLPPRADREDARRVALLTDDVAFLRELYHADVLEFSRLSGLAVHDWPTVNDDAPVR